jgi:amidase
MTILDRDPLGAFCRHTHVELAGAADGPLAGLAFGLKDIFDVAGHRTGFGNPDWLRTHEPATQNAWVLDRLLAAGASLAGRTHTEEMAFSLTGENAHYGTPVNPVAPFHVPGGSSSGSASAVAGHLVDFAIGSDTGGSVRAPASYCGIYGVRPTYGRIPLDGACPLAPGFDTCGWFARDAVLLERVGQVLLGSTGTRRTPGRLLLAEDAFAHALPAAADALAPAVARVEALLGRAQPVTVSAEGLPTWFATFRTLQGAEIWATHGAWITATRPVFGPRIAPRFEAVARITPAEVERAEDHRAHIVAHLEALLAENAILVLPTVPDIAPRLDEPAETAVPTRERALALLSIAGLGGLPQVTLPFASLQGCPLGLSLIAARGRDELLLEVARRLG